MALVAALLVVAGVALARGALPRAARPPRPRGSPRRAAAADDDSLSVASQPSGQGYPNTGNCLLYKMAWPAINAVEDGKLAMRYACNYTAAPHVECGSLSRCYVASPLSEGVCDFELHWVEAPLIYDGEYSTSDWERYFRKLNANMSRGWNAFMHNGVQLYVPDVQSIIDKMKEDGQPFMARSSGAEGEFTHVMFEVTGRVWELVGATNAQAQAPYPRFGEAECGPAHMVRHPSPSALNDAWSLSGAFERPNGLQQPMLMRTTVSAADPEEAARVYFESLHKMTGAYLKHQHSDDSCDVYVVGFDQGDFIEMQFVNNKVSPTGDWSLHDYDSYVQSVHQRFVGDSVNLWDHWLDQHVGFMASYKAQEASMENGTEVDDDGTYECQLSERVEEVFTTLGWPTGTRTGVGCTGVDESGVDQCVTNGNHAYMGVPHSNMAFEFNTDCIDDHALFPSICFCDPWNNNIHYGKVTGSSC